MQEKGIPRSGYEILNKDDELIGNVTSGSMSPSLGIGIGMGYVKTNYAATGNEILIAVRKRKLTAKVVKLPFYKP